MKKSEIIAWLDERIARIKPTAFNVFPDDNFFHIFSFGINVTGDEDNPLLYAGTNGFGKPAAWLPKYAKVTFEEVKNWVEMLTVNQ